ncbi:unnamed protein product, partial [marine sediment metagenome]
FFGCGLAMTFCPEWRDKAKQSRIKTLQNKGLQNRIRLRFGTGIA